MALSVETRVDRLRDRCDLAAQASELMSEYWYRPREVLVHADDLPLVERELRRWEAEPADEQLRERLPYLFRYELPLRRFVLPARMDVHAVVRRLRAVPDGREPRVSANHVFGACQSNRFGPGDNAVGTDEQRELGEPHDEGYVIAVLDSGLVLRRHRRGQNPHVAAHERMLLEPNRPDADIDPLDDEPADGMLDDADVHGGFIADLIRAEAPEASVRVARVLLGGIADETEIANGILRLQDELRNTRGERMHVLNLSLGGYTDENLAPWLIVEALDRLDPRPVVVAAAGNYGRRRPHWPAALKGVIGVGAVDAGGGHAPPLGASFSNHGPWVDACASGVKLLSTFVEFAEELPQQYAGDPNEQAQRFGGWARWSGTSFAAPMVAARIVAKAMASGAGRDEDASHEAVRQAAWDLVWSRASTHGSDLGVYVP